MSRRVLPRVAATALSAIGVLLTGCGASSNSSICSADSFNSSSTNANFQIVPTDYDVTVYPGGTAQLPLLVQPIQGATGAVTLTAQNLPQGLTVDPVTTTIGSTVSLNVHASLDVTSNCFAGVRDVFSAQRSVPVIAKSATGSYTTNVPINIDLANPAFLPAASSGLAVMTITTTAGAPVDSEDDYVDATLTVTDPNNKANNYSGTMGIKGHGNSTWEMPKKPYRLNLDKKTALLGMTSDSNWIMLANYDDKSMLRDDLANQVSNVFGMFWTPSTAFAEVYLNGEYEGVYQVSEKVEVSKARLNIGSIDDTDLSGTNLTGGYLGEIDNYAGETLMLTSQVGLPIGLADPDPPAPEQAAYFTTAFQSAEASFYASNFADTTAGWRSKWNQDSMVQWFLVNELMGNQDANDWSSDYFYKPRGDDSFYMGPVWDFDVSSGNVNYSAIVSPTVPWVSTQSKWFTQLLKDPAFVTAVKAKWTATRPQVGQLGTYLDMRSTALSAAATNNYGRWPTLQEKVWPNSEVAGSYSGEVTFLKNWITQRIAYMDAHYSQ